MILSFRSPLDSFIIKVIFNKRRVFFRPSDCSSFRLFVLSSYSLPLTFPPFFNYLQFFLPLSSFLVFLISFVKRRDMARHCGTKKPNTDFPTVFRCDAEGRILIPIRSALTLRSWVFQKLKKYKKEFSSYEVLACALWS